MLIPGAATTGWRSSPNEGSQAESDFGLAE